MNLSLSSFLNYKDLHFFKIAYMWSNYDYAIPNTGINSVSKQAALSSYHQNVPHYPYANNRSGAVAPYQAFSVGSVRFLLPDLTSEADYNGIHSLTIRKCHKIISFSFFPLDQFSFNTEISPIHLF